MEIGENRKKRNWGRKWDKRNNKIEVKIDKWIINEIIKGGRGKRWSKKGKVFVLIRFEKESNNEFWECM